MNQQFLCPTSLVFVVLHIHPHIQRIREIHKIPSRSSLNVIMTR